MKIMVIDGNSILNRAFYGIRQLTNHEGLPTNAVYGFLATLFKLQDEEQPDRTIVCFDVKEKTFRHLKFDTYKATRKGMPEELAQQMEALGMDESYADRYLNVGFSGGEKKKAEILQMLLLRPSLAILDETDSGLDVDAVRTVSRGVEAYQKEQKGALLIITHSTRILESLHVDYTHILVNGRIVKTGDGSLVDEINARGFEAYEQA